MSGRKLPHVSELIELAEKRGLSMPELMFLIVLRVSMNENNLSCWKSINRLKTEMRCHRSTVKRAIVSLQKKGLVSIGKKPVKTGRLPNNEYSLSFTPESRARVSKNLGSQRTYSKAHKEPSTRFTGSPELGSQGTSNIVNQNRERNSPSNQSRIDGDFTDIFSWRDNQGENWKWQYEDYFEECRNRAKGGIHTSETGFEKKILENIRSGKATDFNPMTDEEIESECLGMYNNGIRQTPRTKTEIESTESM